MQISMLQQAKIKEGGSLVKKFLLLFIFFGVIAFGATNVPNTHLIYTWGYASLMNETLQALRGLLQDSGKILFSISALIGLAVYIFRSSYNDKLNPLFEIGKFFVVALVIAFLFFRTSNDSTHRFMVFDEVTTEVYMVDGIPLGVGATLSFFSRLERGILMAMEKHYSTPDSLSMRNAGVGFSTKAIMNLSYFRNSNSDYVLKYNMDNYIGICYNYNVRYDPNVKQIEYSDNLYRDLIQGQALVLTRGLIAPVMDENRNIEVSNCEVLSKTIQEQFSKLADSNVKSYLKMLNPSQANQANVEASATALSSIYQSNWNGSRDMLQQFMLINFMRDGIRNMEKMYDLGAGTLSTPHSIAHYNLFNQMQQQGFLAQTYLPLIKVYLSMIAASISWIIALLTVALGTAKWLKMYFTLFLWLIIWTPMISLINYFNDLNLMSVFSAMKDTGSGMAMTFAGNTDFFMKVIENANVLNYLVMGTALLSFAIATASGMGFVSFASQLTQGLQGSARTASTFQQQQATATEAKMAIGEEVYVSQPAMNMVNSASWNNGVSSMNSFTFGKWGMQTNADYNIGEGALTFRMGNDGNVISANSSVVGMNAMKSHITQSAENISNDIGSNLATQNTEQVNASYQKALNASNQTGAGTANEIGHQAIEDLQKQGIITKEQADQIQLSGGLLKYVGFGASTSDTDRVSDSLSKAEQDRISEAYKLAFTKNALLNDSVSNAMSESVNHTDSNALQESMNMSKNYQQTMQRADNLNVNTLKDELQNGAREMFGAETWDNANIHQRGEMVKEFGTRLIQGDLAGTHITAQDAGVNENVTAYYNLNGKANVSGFYNSHQGDVRSQDNVNIGSVASDEKIQKLDENIYHHNTNKNDEYDKKRMSLEAETGVGNLGKVSANVDGAIETVKEVASNFPKVTLGTYVMSEFARNVAIDGEKDKNAFLDNSSETKEILNLKY